MCLISLLSIVEDMSIAKTCLFKDMLHTFYSVPIETRDNMNFLTSITLLQEFHVLRELFLRQPYQPRSSGIVHNNMRSLYTTLVFCIVVAVEETNNTFLRKIFKICN